MKNTFEDKKAILELKTLLELYLTDYNTFINNWDQFDYQHNNFNINTYFLEDKFYIYFIYKEEHLTNEFKDVDNFYIKIINKIEDIIQFEDFEKQKEENKKIDIDILEKEIEKIFNNNTNLYLNLKEQYDKTQKYNNDPWGWFRENWGLNWSLESSYDDYENKIRKIYEILIRKEKLKQLETI